MPNRYAILTDITPNYATVSELLTADEARDQWDSIGDTEALVLAEPDWSAGDRPRVQPAQVEYNDIVD